MAFIIKRKKSYSVLYNYIDENGETKQESRTYTVEDIAKILNIGKASAYNFVKEGHFRFLSSEF